jgi:arginine-tRNA-protein transferase
MVLSGIKFGLTQAYQCNYLSSEKEQLLVCMPPDGIMRSSYYEWLITEGFRRSGDQVYRPHCAQCQACKSVRVRANEFSPSKSQRRILNKSSHWQFQLTRQLNKQHFELYEKYICERHPDGTMYPPSREQFDQFAQCSWHAPHLLEAYDGDKLVAVAITDVFRQALSALYTFFDPDYEHCSPGTVMIMQQIDFAKQMNKPYLYLGYQVDACRKMAYKNKFHPQEQFIKGKWTLFGKNTK